MTGAHYFSGRVGGWVALEEWKLRLTSAKVEVEVEAELGNYLDIIWVIFRQY